MIKIALVSALAFVCASARAQNTFPASGNVGIGTTTPTGDLDVYNAYYTHGYKFMDNVMTNASVGFLNPIALALRQGRNLYVDEEFASGDNEVHVYDNHHTGLISITRSDAITDLPNSSGYGLVIAHNGTGEAPGYGGFVQNIHSGINKTIIQLFRAKLPAGYQFNIASNSVGTGGANYWMSNNTGTGKWEWYIRVIQCGNGGPFASSGHVYVSGSPAPSAAAPLVWYMASCTAFDVTNVNMSAGNYVLNQSTSDQNASLRITGNGIIGGNMLIGKTSQTNPAYKLDVNGNIRANKVVVNTTGADYVFDSSYHLQSLAQLERYILNHRHLPGIASAKQMQAEGLDVGENQTALLRKMKELTLYQIRSDKMIKELQDELKICRQELDLLKRKMEKP